MYAVLETLMDKLKAQSRRTTAIIGIYTTLEQANRVMDDG